MLNNAAFLNIKDYTVANPSAGAEWVFNVPTGLYQVMTVKATLLTSSAVANRIPSFIFNNGGGGSIWVPAASAASAASRADIFQAAPGAPNNSVVAVSPSQNVVSLPLPNPLYLVGGDVIGSSTSLLDTADQWLSIRIRLASLLGN